MLLFNLLGGFLFNRLTLGRFKFLKKKWIGTKWIIYIEISWWKFDTHVRDIFAFILRLDDHFLKTEYINDQLLIFLCQFCYRLHASALCANWDWLRSRRVCHISRRGTWRLFLFPKQCVYFFSCASALRCYAVPIGISVKIREIILPYIYIMNHFLQPVVIVCEIVDFPNWVLIDDVHPPEFLEVIGFFEVI